MSYMLKDYGCGNLEPKKGGPE